MREMRLVSILEGKRQFSSLTEQAYATQHFIYEAPAVTPELAYYIYPRSMLPLRHGRIISTSHTLW